MHNAYEKLNIIRCSKFFNGEFYKRCYRDVEASGMLPELHYLLYGASEGRLPAPLVHPTLIRLVNKFKETGNPVLCFERLKNTHPHAYELLSIWLNHDVKNYQILCQSSVFNGELYIKANRDLENCSLLPEHHYLRHGQYEDRNIGPEYQHCWHEVTPGILGKSALGWERYGKQIKRHKDDKSSFMPEIALNSYMTPAEIKQLISNEEIKVVSFDIFDTLLCRPVLDPKDIFRLIDIQLTQSGIRDFYEMRSTIENASQDWLANIDEIYEYMRRKYKLPYHVMKIMKNMELSIEKQLLRRREEVYELYKEAIKRGKTVIAISDMYLGSSYLGDILGREGYGDIKHIYISNECFAWKYNGNLYDTVLKELGISPYTMLHIGDNIVSDYYEPLRKGIIAVYYPKARDKILHGTAIGNFFTEPEGLSERIILGFIFNIMSQKFDPGRHKQSFFADWDEIIKLGILPLLLTIGIYILNNRSIQNGYAQIMFASRDGYLPKTVYDILVSRYGGLPSRYIYAGRRAYLHMNCETFFDYLQECRDALYGYGRVDNFKRTLTMAITDESLLERILKELQIRENERNPDYETMLQMLSPFRSELFKYFEGRKERGRRYYASCVSAAPREIIFDCGFSGSISTNLSPVMEKLLDKIYLYSFQRNYELDMQNGTITYNIIPDHQHPSGALHLAYEELFSPLEGGCVDFNANAAVLQKESFPESMKKKFGETESVARGAVAEFADIMGDYLRLLSPGDVSSLYFFDQAMHNEKDNSWLYHFEDVKFSDPIGNRDLPSLADKLTEQLIYNHPFKGTAFNSSALLLHDWKKFSPVGKIGIHLHAWSKFLMQEIIGYLGRFPYKFDLFITCPQADINYCRVLFSSGLMNKLANLNLISVPNRGRNVGPWVLALRPYQSGYDYFCHIHTKLSDFTVWGSQWRKHLYENLLSPESASCLLEQMEKNSRLGCVFPPPIRIMEQYWIEHNLDPYGNFGEKKMMVSLLERMGIDSFCPRRKLVFPIGTMLWYKPVALHQLFEFPLYWEEFKQEPIGIGGTIAHAIERLPAYICDANGFESRIYGKEATGDISR